MGIKREILLGIRDVIRRDKKSLFYVLYYSSLEGILSLSIPLASSFIINSIIAHASISVLVLGLLVLAVFVLITILRIIQEYIVEKFQQRVFVEKSIEIAEKAHAIRKGVEIDEPIQKVMNYFFDITIIQKFFPIFLLDGVALIVNIIISLLLLLAFNIVLFELGLIALIIYIALLLLLGYNGIKYAIYRSDMKHETIYFLQRLPFSKESKEEALRSKRQLNYRLTICF
jgi:ABC-type bacteriocin/lantibiotic exporter with double-glycine peptidase domain